MMRIAKTRLYQNPLLSLKARTNAPLPSELKPAKAIGINMMACAKMIGITLAAFTFKGMYWRTPPYCLLPWMRFAYCTGIRRVPCTSRIAKANTRIKITISTMNTIKPPPASFKRLENSWMIALGKRAMIPIKMMKEIPFPTPRSVMRSPNHITNIEPAQSRIVEDMVNQLNPTSNI